MQVSSKIQEIYETLTKSEKKVADYVLSNYKTIVHSTMSEIKDIIKVGDATIIRFCQALGFSGFSDLKIEIAKELMTSDQEKDNSDPFLQDMIESLKQTSLLTDQAKIKSATQLMKEAERIFIFGVGHSGLAAQEFQTQLMRLGIQSYFVSDNHFQIHAVSSFTDRDLAIIFSLTGRTKEIIDIATIAKEADGKVVGVTNYLLSPLAQLSDVVVQTSTDEFMDGGSLPGKISQLYVVGTILNEIQNSYDKERIITVREKALRSIIPRQVD